MLLLDRLMGDIAGLAIINTGSGTVTLNSAGSITDDADDTTMISSGVLDATASTGGIKIDTSVEVANISADGDIDLNEADSIAAEYYSTTNKGQNRCRGINYKYIYRSSIS